MKKLLIGAAIAVVSFTAGLAGLYFAIPVVSPQRAEEARQLVDSLRGTGQITEIPADSVSMLKALASTVLPPAPDSAALAVEDSIAAADSLAAAERSAVTDSLDSLRERLRRSERERQTLATRLKAAERTGAARANTEAQVTELAGTLASIEDKELGAILSRLDIETVQALYERSSGRNRARLLQAMPADRAARFVRQIVRPGAPPLETPPTAAEPTGDDAAAMPAENTAGATNQ